MGIVSDHRGIVSDHCTVLSFARLKVSERERGQLDADGARDPFLFEPRQPAARGRSVVGLGQQRGRVLAQAEGEHAHQVHHQGKVSNEERGAMSVQRAALSLTQGLVRNFL